MSELDDVLARRNGNDQDFSYVIKSWINSYRSSPIARSLRDCYFLSWKRVVSEHLRTATMSLAVLRDDPFVIIGYVVYEPSGAATLPSTVHYVYVRDDWRRRGVARWMLEPMSLSEGTQYTHTPNPVITIPKGWQFAPPIPEYRRAG